MEGRRGVGLKEERRKGRRKSEGREQGRRRVRE
jgi:hypothetical protein